ncbi:MAG: tyrosine-type recombinase/integrase [Burkholderiales bacterium]|nr:tyrosine-type recombinase/integrase [Burkholderiales bacterium]
MRKLTDQGGLYLLVKPAGKYWRFDYRFEGRRRTMALGVYPELSLKGARAAQASARKLIESGVDPMAERRMERAVRRLKIVNTFAHVAEQWCATRGASWSQAQRTKVDSVLRLYLLPAFGSLPVSDVTAAQLLAAARAVEDRGAHETAHRIVQVAGQVLRFALLARLVERDCSTDLRGLLKPVRVRHHPSPKDPREVGELLRALHSYGGDPATCAALKLAPMLFVRPGELRGAQWAEIDFERAEWRIPAERMKMRAPHVVPLSTQALEILRALQPVTGRGRYVFPGLRTPSRPISNNTMNAALRRLGFDRDTITAHGFRGMATTLLNEQGWNRDAIERQLAHAERDSVRAAYNHAEYMPERRRMMQSWADYLDGLRLGADVVPLRRAAS